MRARPSAARQVLSSPTDDIEALSARFEELSERRRETVREYRTFLETVRRVAHLTDAHADLYQRAVVEASIDELTHLDLVTLGRTLKVPVSPADSFFRSIVIRRRKKQLGPVPERYLGISKEHDQNFATAAGIRQPLVLFSGALTDVPQRFRTRTFLKPINSSGSKGAFYLFAADRIRSVQHARDLSGWDELIEEVVEQFGEDFARSERWQVQELVYEAGNRPARDLKFYSFYGQIGLIQEVSRSERAQYQYFDEDGSVAACGRQHEPRYDDGTETITDKGGVSEDRLEVVRRVSRMIPAPFMRIDFLNGSDELVFLEFSSAPGMAHTLSDEYDERLGAMYHAAEVRLVNDLLGGKQFAEFATFSSTVNRPAVQTPPARRRFGLRRRSPGR